MNRKTKTIGAFISLFLTAGVCAYSLNGIKNDSNKKIATIEHMALFDYFNYKGEEEYYKKHPLPGADYFYNPILPGWYSDPSVCSNGEDYFLVTSTFTYYPGVPIFHSKDLVNWKQVGNILNRPSQLVNLQGQGVSGGIFAPAIEYNPHNKTYYMVTTNVGAGNFFVKTQDPFGEWSDPIMLPEVRGIDPSFFFDEDGKAYIVNNDDPEGKPEYDGHRSIRIQEFDVSTDKTIGPRKVLVNKGSRPEEKPIWPEGPHMYKINGKYLLMCAEGGTGDWHSEAVFSGQTPMGTFTPWEKNPILTQRHLDKKRPNPITCAGHADLIKTKEGDWWGVFLACRPIDSKFENLGRETFIMPVKWSKDGFPYMTEGDDLIPRVLQREGVKKEKQVTFGNFEEREEFNDNALAMNWMTLRSPGKDLYSLNERAGFLGLKCSDVKATEKKTPAFVCRRVQHEQFEASTKLFFNPSDEKESAGILLFKDERHQYFLATGKDGNDRFIRLEEVSKEGERIIVSNKIDSKTNELNLKVISTGPTFEFYYATKENQWNLLCKDIDASLLSTAKTGGFTGTTIGLYAVSK